VAVGVFAWWAIGSVTVGVVAGLIVCGGAFVAGWELEAFLPPKRRLAGQPEEPSDLDGGD